MTDDDSVQEVDLRRSSFHRAPGLEIWLLVMAILPLQLARVSNLLRTSVATQNLAGTQAQLLNLQNQLSTGKRLNSPSDDPGAAAIAQQLRKTLESHKAFAENLTQAQSQLGAVDSSLGDLTSLLEQAQSIASSNIGSDVTPDQRKAAAQIAQSLYNQALSLSNKQLNGVFLFAGDRSTAAPFVEANGGVQFDGSNTLLTNQYDESTGLKFQVDGGKIFGAPSNRVRGNADLSPTISASTRISDLRGATDHGVRPGSIIVSVGTTTGTVDLSKADTVGDVINAINNAAVGAVTASIAGDGVSIQLSGGGGDNVSVNEVGGGVTASDLGILNVAGAGTGVALDGANVFPMLTNLTPLAGLKGGAGIDLTGFQITNGQASATIDLTGATTIEDLLNRVNGSETGVRGQINAAGDGIDLLNTTQGTTLTISELGGTTAADLGVRSFSPSSPLSELNDGQGVRTVSGDDVRITDSNGVPFDLDLSGLNTVQDVIDAINTGASGAGAGVTASFATTGNGIVLTDTAGGAGSIAVSALNFSEAANDLGITKSPSGNVISGDDVDGVKAVGVFSNLSSLINSLSNNDQAGITAAAEGLKADYDRIVQIRGETGARVQELETRQGRLEDQNIATQSMLSNVEDTDYTQAIAQFQTLQTTLQASLQTAQKVLNLSLMDFLG
jgi:flagellar hook-associated protein 3